MLPYVVGIVLSIGVALFARLVRLDRDRAFYPTVTIVIASYYVLFGAMTGSVQTVVLESAVMTLFVIAPLPDSRGAHGLSLVRWLAMAFRTPFTATSSRMLVCPPGGLHGVSRTTSEPQRLSPGS
jgi:hypothetical protein